MRLIVLASRAVDLDRRIYRVVCFVVSRMAAVVVSGVVRVEGRGAQYELNVSYVEIARVATSPSGVGLSWMGRDEKAEEIKGERKKSHALINQRHMAKQEQGHKMTCVVATLCGFGPLKTSKRKVHSEQYVYRLGNTARFYFV